MSTEQAGQDPHVTEEGFLAWIDRVFAATGILSAVGAILIASEQLSHLSRGWVLVVAGTLVCSGAFLPLFAWRSAKGMWVPATLYATAVGIGLWTWPLAWIGPVAEGPDHAPWLWPCIGVSTVLVWISWSAMAAIRHNLICSAAYLVARLSPIGVGVDVVTAVQDTLVVAFQPLLILLLFDYVRRQTALLDAWVSAARTQRADAVLRGHLADERARLDAAIHDEVMTTLVAAARSVDGEREHVNRLAARALGVLEGRGDDEPGRPALGPAAAGRLLHEVALGVTPDIRFIDEVDALAPLVPEEVVQSLARAVREAVLNADRHAQAHEVSLTVSLGRDSRGVRLRAVVVDDGIGFDPAAVPERRLGIRLALQRRMRSVGGEALVDSRPGEGTRVELLWVGAAGASSGNAGRDGRLPLLSRVGLGPVAFLAGAGATLHMLVVLLQSVKSPRPELIWISVGLLGIILPLCLRSFGRRLAPWRAATSLVLGLLVVALNLRAVPGDVWSVHGTAFVGAICVVVALMRAGGRTWAAWALALATAVMVLDAARRAGVSWHLELGDALGPVAWLLACELLIAWIRRTERSLDRAQIQADAATTESSAAFARLVVREVWLAEIRDQVGDLLERLADPGAPITPLIREACLAAEGSLRDRIRAANFAAPGLAAAIMRARMRGVEVTLVDNRVGPLDQPVRRVAVRHLERIVDETESGRIIARTAPEGYDEAVTIVQTGSSGSALTRINDDGTMVVVQT